MRGVRHEDDTAARRLRTLAVSTALGAAVAGLGAVAGAAEVRAQTADADRVAQAEAARDFDIPAQALADALAAFGAQAGLQVSAHGEAVRELRTRGVSGRMTPEAALGELLAGTGLDYRLGESGAVITRGGAATGDGGTTVLSPITVEGEGGAHPGAADQAHAIAVGPEDLARRNPQTVKDVFAGESGVSVGGAVPLSQKVYVNGVEETNLAVSIDGTRQNNKVFHHSGTTRIDPALLKRARVDPGVAPADAGPGALGGSIAYETVDVADMLAPGRDVGGYVSGSFDSNGETITGSSSAYGRAGGFEILGFAKSAQGGAYEGGDGTTVYGTSAELLSGLAKTAYESESGHRLEISAERLNDDSARPYRANMRDLPGRNDPLVRDYDLTRENYTATYSTPEATGLWDPKAVLGYSNTEIEVPQPFGSIGATGSISGKLENDFNITPDHTVTAGVDFYKDTARYEDPTVPRLEEAADNAGAYAQARLEPYDSVRLSLGGRGDYQRFEGIDGTEMTNAGLSGNASAAFDIGEHVTLRGGYSNVWGGIALAENFIFNQNWSYARDIEPVRAENYTTGIDMDYAGFSFSVGAFRSVFDNARDASFGGGPSGTVDFETRGYDLGAGYNWGPGFVRATFTDSEIVLNGQPGSTFSTQYRGTPLGQVIAVEAAHSIVGTGVTVGGTIDAALTNTDTVDAGGQKQEAYTVYNLYTEYQPAFADNLTLRLEANNVFDEEYADRATYGQDFASVDPLLEQGRSFLVYVEAAF